MTYRSPLAGALLAFLLLLVTTPVSAQLSTSTHIDFDGSPFTPGQSVHGLTLQNVLFEFFIDGVASGDAQVGPGPAGGLTFFSTPNALSGPVGPTSKLVMNFLNPVWYFEFSLARNVVSHESCSWWHSTADVTVFGGFGQRQSTMDLWTETGNNDWMVGEFTEDPDHNPQNYLTRVEIEFSEGGGVFLLDEIEAQHAPISVPEPGTILLLASGLLAMLGLSLRRGAPGRAHHVTERA
jgi:hypothetical protein